MSFALRTRYDIVIAGMKPGMLPWLTTMLFRCGSSETTVPWRA